MRICSPWVLEWWLAVRSARKVREENERRFIVQAPRENERYEEVIQFLLDRGLDEYAVRVGSIPSRSLEYIGEVVRHHLPERPIRALHIGNFVGVSLCHVSWMVREKDPSSIVLSVDPNQPHMGIEDPEFHARALLEKFGLLSTNLIIRGYTMAATPGADGASVNVLAALQPICGRAFELVLIDGSHEEHYLSDEFRAVRGLLADNSIVVFDDIEDFAGVASVFGQVLRDETVVKLGEDGRVGIVQVRLADRVSSGATF
jgi:hypothetical protein